MSAPSEPPVIGICAVRERARWSFWDQEAHLVADAYVACVQRAGAVAVLLAVDARAPEVLLERIDGLLLIGGADVDLRTYGAARDPATEKTYPERDDFELALLHGAFARRLPVLAICRGMQLMNVALGGTLGAEPDRLRRLQAAPLCGLLSVARLARSSPAAAGRGRVRAGAGRRARGRRADRARE